MSKKPGAAYGTALRENLYGTDTPDRIDLKGDRDSSIMSERFTHLSDSSSTSVQKKVAMPTQEHECVRDQTWRDHSPGV